MQRVSIFEAEKVSSKVEAAWRGLNLFASNQQPLLKEYRVSRDEWRELGASALAKFNL